MATCKTGYHTTKRILTLLLLTLSVAVYGQKRLVSEADKLVQQKRFTEAEALYIQALEKSKNDVQTVVKLADCFYQAENYFQAEKYYARYFGDTAYSATVHFRNYASAARNTGNVRRMVRLYREIAEKTQDQEAQRIVEDYSFLLDSMETVHSFDLDSNYNCVDLDARASADPDAAPMLFIWKFSDGTTESGFLVTHCFRNAGTHQVTLGVRDNATGVLRENDTTFQITIEPHPAHFASPQNGKRYIYVELDASASDVSKHDVIDYVWEMGNGQLLTGKKAKYKYTEYGDYTIRLFIIARKKEGGQRELLSAKRKITITDSYVPPEN